MTTKPDPYASEAASRALMAADTRPPHQRTLDQMLADRHAWEPGHEAYRVLYQIALELVAKQAAEPNAEIWPCEVESVDFESDTVTLKMQCTDYKVSAGQHWLIKATQGIKGER